MQDRSKDLFSLLMGAVRDAAPLNLGQFREEARMLGFNAKDVSRALMLALSRGDAVLDRNMELVVPSPENPFLEFC